MPGLTDLPDAGDLRKVLARTGESVRRLVAAAVAAVPDEGDRGVLERRLGLSGGGPQTLHRSELTSGSRVNGSGSARTGPLRRSRPGVPARVWVPRILSPYLTWTFALSPRMLEAAYWARFAVKGRIRHGW